MTTELAENAVEPETESAAPVESTFKVERKEGGRKQRVGVVVSDKMDKTIVVAVVTRVPHRDFGKIVKRTKKLYAHDEEGRAVAGDKVLIEEMRPISKTKCWKLVEVLSH